MAYPFRDEERPDRPMWATWVLLCTCLVAFAFFQPKPMQGISHGLTVEDDSKALLQIRHFEDRWALVPCEVTHARSIAAGASCGGFPSDHPGSYAEKNVYAPLLTSLFIHANLLHLLSNLLFLWVFGRGLEERIGAPGVLALFVAGGIAAGLGYIAVHPESADPLLGASGAIAALMGAYLILNPGRRILSLVYSAGLQVVYLPAWAILGFFLLSQFLTDPTSRVAWEAHVAGMVFGAAVAGWLRWRPGLHGPSAPTAAVAEVPKAPPPWPVAPPSAPPS